MTIEEIEAACETSEVLDFSQAHAWMPLELSLSRDILSAGVSGGADAPTRHEMLAEARGEVGDLRETVSTRSRSGSTFHVVETDSTECPPRAVVRRSCSHWW